MKIYCSQRNPIDKFIGSDVWLHYPSHDRWYRIVKDRGDGYLVNIVLDSILNYNFPKWDAERQAQEKAHSLNATFFLPKCEYEQVFKDAIAKHDLLETDELFSGMFKRGYIDIDEDLL